jgi:hypothetical protein
MIDNYLVVVKLFFRGGAFALLLAHPFLKTYQPAGPQREISAGRIWD